VQLDRLLRLIDADMDHSELDAAALVFVGDYIDRGDHSADVLRFLKGLSTQFPSHVTCLKGNHEQMLCEFLRDPLGRPKRWLRYGGIQTLASFGIAPPQSLERPSASDLLDASADLRDAIGSDMLAWLENLPAYWQSGNVWAVHAGADPHLPMTEQPEERLIWGHDLFFKIDRTDGQWVAVGHEPFDTPIAERGKIAVDTGAVFGGALTAARLVSGAPVKFLQTL
jgi:serine/threonine protein phosphatase 1